MNSLEIKKFLLKHKKDFQKYLDKNIFGFCITCPMFKDTKEEIHYKNISCSKVYEYIVLSLGKEPKSSIIKTGTVYREDCEGICKEMINLASNAINITITNE